MPRLAPVTIMMPLIARAPLQRPPSRLAPGVRASAHALGPRRQRVAIERCNHDAHDDHSNGVKNDLLRYQVTRHRLHGVINEVVRNDGEEGDCETETNALGDEGLILAPLAVNPG